MARLCLITDLLRDATPMKRPMIAAVICVIAVTAHVSADEKQQKERLDAHFRELYGKFGQNGTTKIKIVSRPEKVEMRNGRVPGRRWFATSGDYRFKLTIQDGTDVKVEQVVGILEKLPVPYIRACEVVSDDSEDGIAVYKDLGGASAHGGKSYINIVPGANHHVIAHEAGHALEQKAREADAEILDKWEEAIKADRVSVSAYGDNVRHEDQAEFAKLYAVCLDAGDEHLAELKQLSPARFALWEKMLYPPDAE